ncbi:hypothetical protein FB468_0636 [Leucobacter komagatae]|uniref:Uncharacterized protein n=1 Tax=Leucobacter komagatae TaxID=55969 RepID=A0A542Y3J4_9MICO|nr:hypothetical protein [Leucobacter komagatae]TQL42633.1 hypothetical protein FB468_0636 [Leucobacter komagatae]
MLEILIAAYLANIIPGLPSPVDTPWKSPALPVVIPVEANATALCEVRAVGVADALGAASHGNWDALEQAGIEYNPVDLDGDACRIGITDDVHRVGLVDGIEKITGVGPTRFAVIWKANS